MTRAVEYADDQVAGRDALFFGNSRNIFSYCLVEIDDVRRIAWAYRNLVHIHVGGVKQIAFFRHGQHSKCIRTGLGSNCSAFERIERDVDPWAFADCSADFFADKQHRRFVALAFADDHGAVHIKFVECRAHRFDGGVVCRFFVAATDQFGGGNRGGLGHADHFENQYAVKDLACCGHVIFLAV